MYSFFADYFVDPDTKEPLILEIFEKNGDQINEGILKNKNSVYPVKGGIPRFVTSSDNYANSFGFQWEKWSRIQFESDNIGKPMEGHTRKMFNTITANSIEHIKKDDVILDIGCGSGRFIDVIRMRCDNPIIGIDFSNSVEIAYTNFLKDKNICIVQADALRLPFRADTFQGSFSIGVLHHTPDPIKGVKEAFRVLTKGGWFGLSVYQKNSYYDKPVLKFYRKQDIYEEIYRELARTDPFRTTWSLGGSFQGVFGISTSSATIEQKTISMYSRMYDNVQESMETPASEVIEDDDMLDGWFVVQKRKRDEEKKKSGTADIGHGGAQDVYLMADGKKDIEKIQDMNTLQGKMVSEQRHRVVEKKGKISHEELPDVKRDLQMQSSQMQSQKKG